MEKLGQLQATGDHDLVVLDTAPSGHTARLISENRD